MLQFNDQIVLRNQNTFPCPCYLAARCLSHWVCGQGYCSITRVMKPYVCSSILTDVQKFPNLGLAVLGPFSRARTCVTGARYDHLLYVVSLQCACACACHDSPIRVVQRDLHLRLPPPMSVYDPYNVRYRTPSALSYSYAPSSTLSSYTTDNWYSTRELPTGAVSERMYFNLNGKLVRSYKSRSYRVCPSVFASAAAMLTLKCGYREHRDKCWTCIQTSYRVSHPPAFNST